MDREAVVESELQSTATEAATVVDWSAVRTGTHVVPLELVFETAENARYVFEQAELDELAELLKSTNGINAFAGVARRVELLGEFQGFELIEGARRLRALKLIGAPAMKLEIVEVYDAKATRHLAMMSRKGKVDLSPMEYCREYHRMIEAGDYPNVKAMAQAFGKKGEDGYRSIVAIMSLDKAEPEVVEALEKHEISKEHAVVIAAEKPDDQVKLLGMCHEPESVTLGALPEMVKRLISVKQLRSIIQTQFREPEKEKAELLNQAAEVVEKKKAKDTALEASADRLLGDDANGLSQSHEEHEEPQRTAEDEEEEVDENEMGTSQSKYDPKPQAPYAGHHDDDDTAAADLAEIHAYLTANFIPRIERSAVLPSVIELLGELLSLREFEHQMRLARTRKEIGQILVARGAVARGVDIDPVIPEKKVVVKKLTAAQIEQIGENAIRTVFQNCDMEDLLNDGATFDGIHAWMCKQLGDKEAWQDFPADEYAGRTRAWLNNPVVCVYRSDADAEISAQPLFISSADDLVAAVRAIFCIAEPVKEKVKPVKKPAKKAAVKKAAKAPAKKPAAAKAVAKAVKKSKKK